jgi:HAD superfamily hydrolase (TIGR01509 family)
MTGAIVLVAPTWSFLLALGSGLPLPYVYTVPFLNTPNPYRVILEHTHVKEALVPSRPVIFLDDGGVMNDNSVRSGQWQRMVGDYLAPILGGEAQAWADANRTVMAGMFADTGAWEARLSAAPDYTTFDYQYHLDWLCGMCKLVGIAPPPAAESVELGRRAYASIIPRVQSAFPGAIETIRLLRNRGYTLHTASGESSTDLKGYLAPMGVRDCFGRLYGPDLIQTFKNGPEFYERLLADAGVAPPDALVLDDSPKCVAWAEQAGARAVLVSNTPQSPGTTHVISGLAALPDFIGQRY